MKKRILSVFLVLCITLALVPLTVYASNPIEKQSEDGANLAREQWLDFIANQQTNEDGKNDNGQMSSFSLNNNKFVSEANIVTPAALSLKTTPQASITSRYTVLVLDESGSMAGSPMTALKAAALKFCDAVLKADGDNYVAIISYYSSARTLCDFSNSYTSLETAINDIYAGGSTNTNDGLLYADDLLGSISDQPGIIKNIVLLSDGLPNVGSYSESGNYTYNDYYYYQYANKVYNSATTLKAKGYNLYSLGFFHSLSDSELPFARRFMTDLQNSGYYDVTDPNNLEFVFGEIATDITKKSGTFRYPGTGRDYSAVYYYDDGYFSGSSYRYNQHLATMSLCFELSAWGSEEVGNSYTDKSINAKNLLSEIGFLDFETNNWFKVKPTKDSIGAVAANKTITVNGKTYTLIALAVRGGGYESEWASNFTIGKSGTHQGFSQARNQVLEFLNDYISRNQISGDIKIWLTGYSRAAATANMVAGAIDDGSSFSNCTLALSDLYSYTFETPAGALMPDVEKPVYNNIFNIINRSDLVTKVAPAYWSFSRYGIDKILPSKETQSEKIYPIELGKMLERYYTLDSTSTYTVDDFRMKKIKVDGWSVLPGGNPFISIVDDTKNNQSQSMFLDDYINKRFAGEFIKTRTNFVANYQNGIRELLGLFFSADKVKTEKLISVATDKFTKNWGDIIAPLIWNNPFKSASDKEKEAYGVIARFLRESLTEAGITYDETTINDATVALADLLVALVVNHPNLASTMALNINGIGSAHYPDLCLAWMQSMDSNYTNGGDASFCSGSYRIIRINCPVDVEVYNDNGDKVAAIVSDVPQDVGSSIISSINEDGEKLILLPAEASYNIRTTATGQGTMSFSINEYSPDMGSNTRIVNYYDIPITTGAALSANISSFNADELENGIETGSSAAYSLKYDTTGEEVIADSDLSGKEATEAYYMINVTSEDNMRGLVAGQGPRQLGSYAQVSAISNNGYEFEGWYSEGKKVSSNSTYRFRVESDIDLVAKFSVNSYTLTLSAGNGGTITKGASAEYETGATISLTAAPNSNYRFVNWTSSNGGIFTDANSASTTFNMPATATSVTANFENVGGQSSVGGAPSVGGGGTISNNSVSWAAVLNQISSAREGDLIAVDMKNETVLPTSILKAIDGRDITIILNMDKYSWNINGKNIKEVPNDKSSYDLKVSAITDSELSKLADGTGIAILELTHNGSLPFTGSLKWSVGIDQNGKSIFLNHYNEELKRLEYREASTVDTSGNVSYEFGHGSRYILTTMTARGTYIKTNPILGKSELYSYIPNIIENNISTIIKFSALTDDSVEFYAPKTGLYEFRNNEKLFNDINGHWAANAINFITARELFAGVGKSKFNPNGKMTRAMFATVLAQLDSADLSSYTESKFADVKMNTWYGSAVAWAADKGIISGFVNDIFVPNDFITREQIAVMLSNYIKYKGIVLPSVKSDPFTDRDQVSSWAEVAVADMQRYGMITGVGNNMYAPKETANRAGVAQLLMNFINACVKYNIDFK